MRFFSGRCTSTARLDGKTAIVTGSNTGIGKETVKDFVKRGARVIMACRSLDKAESAAEEIINDLKNQEDIGQIVIKQLDLGSLTSVRNCAQDILGTENRIDLLINNAGIMCCPQATTEDNFEIQFGTNHLGHFLLTLLLLPRIAQSRPSRIVNVSSVAHERGHIQFDDLNWEKRSYSSIAAYQQSKLANVLFTKELALRIKEANITGLTVYSLHPGVIRTELGRYLDSTYFYGLHMILRILGAPFVKSPQLGAQTTIYCAVDEKTASETGLYYSDCQVVEPAPKANNLEDAKKLWQVSVKLVGLEDDYDLCSMK